MDTETTSLQPDPTPPTRAPLVRPVEGRAVAGVAAGLARYLNVGVGLIRFAFLVAVIFGGMGLVLYGAGWLLIRDEAESESIAQRLLDNLGSGPSWLGVTLLILAGVIVLDNFTFMPGSLIWAIVLVTVGLLLYRGDLGRDADPPKGERRSEDPHAEGGTGPEPGGGAPPAPPAEPRPSATTPPSPPPPPPPPSLLGRLTIGVGLLALGALAIADNLTPLVDPRPRHYLALATVVLGLGLLTGAFVGRGRWMILLGVLLVPMLLASPAAEVNWDASMRRVVTPAGLEELQTSYTASAGSYVFDLTGAEWDGEEVSLDVDLAAGEIVVAVPDDVAVTGTADVGIGAIEIPGAERAGVGELRSTLALPGDGGSLDVDLEVGVGVIRIHTGEGPPELSSPRFRGWGVDRVSVTERSHP
ncbi:MAG: PspC domain-containing protein [Actinomycetota bacterium]